MQTKLKNVDFFMNIQNKFRKTSSTNFLDSEQSIKIQYTHQHTPSPYQFFFQIKHFKVNHFYLNLLFLIIYGGLKLKLGITKKANNVPFLLITFSFNLIFLIII